MLSIIRFYGGDVSLDRLTEYTNTTHDGTTAYHLIEGAKKVGLNAKGLKCDINNLKKISSPFIAHVKINNSYEHFIVVYKINNKNIKIMDPSSGMKKISIEEFNQIWTNVIIIFYPIKSLPIIKVKRTLTSFVSNLLKPLKKELIILSIISIVITLSGIGYSYYFQVIINSVDINSLVGLSLLFLIVIIIKIISEYYRSKIIIFMNKVIDKKITIETYEHILSLPYKYYKNKSIGDILTRISDLNNIKDLISEGAVTIFIDSVLIIISSIFMYMINIKLFIISIIISILYIITSIVFNKILYSKIEESFEKQSNVNSYLIESISSYETIKGINIKNSILKSFKEKFMHLLNSANNILKISNIQETIKNIVDYIGNFFILFVGTVFVLKENITLGELFTYNALYTYFINPIKSLVNYQITIKKGIIALKRINELYDIEEEKMYEHSTKSNEFKGYINVENLCFSYDDINNVINKLNFEIKPKDKIMIMGPSGSGKSTLLKLILKNYTCKKNMIKIDNIDINDYNLNDIRNNIAYVSQQEILYNDTVYNNLDIGRNNDIKTINKICKLTYINEIVDKTPFGLDMMIEENGFNISGGERQRIVLGRTLLGNQKMIILDESTNQIDIKLERKILKNMLEEYDDKTIIFVSHRHDNKDLFNKVLNI